MWDLLTTFSTRAFSVCSDYAFVLSLGVSWCRYKIMGSLFICGLSVNYVSFGLLPLINSRKHCIPTVICVHFTSVIMSHVWVVWSTINLLLAIMIFFFRVTVGRCEENYVRVSAHPLWQLEWTQTEVLWRPVGSPQRPAYITYLLCIVSHV